MDRLTDALIRAAQTFKPELGNTFATHASWWLWSGASGWRRSRHRQQWTMSDFNEFYGEPSYDRPLILSGPHSREPGPEEAAQEAERGEQASKLLDRMRQRLPPSEWELLMWRHRDGLTLLQIASRRGVSKERVRQLLKRLDERIRMFKEAWVEAS